MTDDGFEATWRNDLTLGVLGVQLVDVDHPLEIYVGASDLGNPRVQIRSSVRPKEPRLGDVVVVDRAETSGSWLLSLTLQDPRFTEVFIRLAGDVVARSRPCADEAEALAAVDTALDEWRRLLKPRALGRLGIDELRGLVGELFLLLERFADGRSFDQALAGWLGPLGAPQDFWYVESGFHEAKSIGASASTIQVNSAEQLDQTGMELIVVTLPQVPESTDGAVNLKSLVDRAADALDSIAVDHSELELRMKRMGVDLSDSYYAETWFVVASESRYTVGVEFPAIRASELPGGIGSVVYRIAVAALGPFESATAN